MSEINARTGYSVNIEAKVICADGTEIDLGQVANSEWDKKSSEAKEAKKRIKAANSRLNSNRAGALRSRLRSRWLPRL